MLGLGIGNAESGLKAEGMAMSSYHIAKNGQPAGPFEESEVLKQLAAGLITTKDLCWCEGMAEWQPIDTVLSAASLKSFPPPPPGTEPGTPLFLYIPISRLILMSIVSLGLYEVYWIYKNWSYVKERDHLIIRPFARACFGLFYCHSLLSRIHEDKVARSLQTPSFSPGVLATTWVVSRIVSNLAGRAPGTSATLISVLIPAFLCFVPVQRYVNSVSELRTPGQPYYRWSAGHVVCLVIGLIAWVFILEGFRAQ
jgi:hypothetical protein